MGTPVVHDLPKAEPNGYSAGRPIGHENFIVFVAEPLMRVSHKIVLIRMKNL